MHFIGIDLEGVLVPEIWETLAKKTRIKELELTTKDIPSYPDLMTYRINVLNKKNIKAKLLFDIAKTIKPFKGALKFLTTIRKSHQVIILSDTFFNLSQPIFKKLNFPTVLCHHLLVNKGMVVGMERCTVDHKRKTIKFMNKLSNRTIAIGDSYNDLNMLNEARYGILFKSTKKIISENKNFFSCNSYNSLLKVINKKHFEWTKENDK
ncbi:bifunctional phosphoserine phosphatase/homoserine phosphotransferase ThrH [Alphaproteobacteria bacterium]|nr:bifunctional phosphoserine phosphatase/homoserine phosphotransferase ThrH [Alphaproteobacteria bacterium]